MALKFGRFVGSISRLGLMAGKIVVGVEESATKEVCSSSFDLLLLVGFLPEDRCRTGFDSGIDGNDSISSLSNRFTPCLRVGLMGAVSLLTFVRLSSSVEAQENSAEEPPSTVGLKRGR